MLGFVWVESMRLRESDREILQRYFFDIAIPFVGVGLDIGVWTWRPTSLGLLRTFLFLLFYRLSYACTGTAALGCTNAKIITTYESTYLHFRVSVSGRRDQSEADSLSLYPSQKSTNKQVEKAS